MTSIPDLHSTECVDLDDVLGRRVAAETLLVRLDLAGVAAAAGAACHSGAIETSHVLDAMGIAPVAASESVRFSFGRDDDAATGAAAAQIVSGVIESLS